MRQRKNILKYWDRSIFDKYIKYNSQEEPSMIETDIVPKTDAETYILFENEKIIAVIDQRNHCVDFYKSDDTYLTSEMLPVVEDGRKVYMNICCGVLENCIKLKFPVCEWIDHYPHCDGEYDRWSTRTLGYHVMVFDLETISTSITLY